MRICSKCDYPGLNRGEACPRCNSPARKFVGIIFAANGLILCALIVISLVFSDKKPEPKPIPAPAPIAAAPEALAPVVIPSATPAIVAPVATPVAVAKAAPAPAPKRAAKSKAPVKKSRTLARK